jgi:hypothetical protein
MHIGCGKNTAWFDSYVGVWRIRMSCWNLSKYDRPPSAPENPSVVTRNSVTGGKRIRGRGFPTSNGYGRRQSPYCNEAGVFGYG